MRAQASNEKNPGYNRRPDPMRTGRLAVGAAVCLFVNTGCSTQPTCIAEPSYGLFLEIRDAVTSVPAANGAVGRAVGAGVAEVLELGGSPPGLVLFGVSVPGEFRVTVTKPGYVPWQRSHVVIRQAGECSLAVTRIDVQLEPQ